MYKLRDYQQEAVKAVLNYFRHHSTPSVLVLPTGAGKSLVIAELARIARGNVLVLAHVKELVEQNHDKYESYGLTAGIYSAGLGRKDTTDSVVFASVQSISRNLAAFDTPFSLLIIDECHRVSEKNNSSYQKVIQHLKEINPGIKILGLTATPYRLGLGWIYQYHTKGAVRSEDARFFRDCIFELPIQHLLDEFFLTPAKIIDAPILSYDFSQLKPTIAGKYKHSELDLVIEQSKRATPQIIEQIRHLSSDRQGVMIFAATVRHAEEIYQLLDSNNTAIITGDTVTNERDRIISEFKDKKIKYLVNVSVLTTGFDAPHVDLIAILRPTESISLYQQIVGRGLRLSPGKTECLVLDYAGNSYDLYQPEVGQPPPDSDSEIITIPCPACGFNNNFWGKLDSNGFLIEHFGRKCQGYFTDEETLEREHCNYRFRAKYCNECGADNDIAARICVECEATLVDPDKKLKEALKLKDALVYECTDMTMQSHQGKAKSPQLKITYHGDNDAAIHEFWSLNTPKQKEEFKKRFVRMHLADKHTPYDAFTVKQVTNNQHRFRLPQFIIARKSGRFWALRDKIFDDELN
ncbi:DEAD/DEAH box helicase [Vibrio sp.]|nr:DEAD/DEAH box helicase [Vibrio sp.]